MAAVPIRLFTDAHISPSVAHTLVQLGFDVVCARDRGLRRAEDWELMRWCIDHRYAICTKNQRHFEQEPRQAQNRGEEHPGILLIEDWPTDDILWALRQYLESSPDPELLSNHVVKLAQATPEFRRERGGEVVP
jgi:predicted nuclease of predicted toxin-antitoxin system